MGSVWRMLTEVVQILTRSRLFNVGFTPLNEVLGHIVVAVPAGDDKRRRAADLRTHQHVQLVCGAPTV